MWVTRADENFDEGIWVIYPCPSVGGGESTYDRTTTGSKTIARVQRATGATDHNVDRCVSRKTSPSHCIVVLVTIVDHGAYTLDSSTQTDRVQAKEGKQNERE